MISSVIVGMIDWELSCMVAIEQTLVYQEDLGMGS